MNEGFDMIDLNKSKQVNIFYLTSGGPYYEFQDPLIVNIIIRSTLFSGKW